MAWRLVGQLIESCSCNMMCPCWYMQPEVMVMDQGWCASPITFRIRQGNADNVNLSGRTVVVGYDFPGPTLFDGKGTARIYIDQGASDDQQRELQAIFMGKKGGPMEGLAPLVTTWLPMQSANIEIQEQGDTITITVGNVGQVQSKLLRDVEGHSFTLQGGGFVGGLGMEAAELAPTIGSSWSDPGLRRFETKSGARGNFSWSD